MIISLQLRAIEEKTKPYFQLLGCDSPYPAGEYSRKSFEHEGQQVAKYIWQCMLRPQKCLIYRQWTYETQPDIRFILRPSPDSLTEEFINSSLAFVCRLNDEGDLELCETESRTGEGAEIEMLYKGDLVVAERSIFSRTPQTDNEGRAFLDSLPEAGLDLKKPLASWNTYLDWRQKLADRKANEGYAYRDFRLLKDGSSVDFFLTVPNVRELLKTRLSGETIRVFSTEPPSESGPNSSPAPTETARRPPPTVFEGSFRSVRSIHNEHSIRGRGNYNLRKEGKPKGDPEPLVVRLTADADDEKNKSAIHDIADCGILKAAMEGELAAVDVQRNGLRRLAEFKSLNPNIRRWLFDPAAAKPLSDEPVPFTPDSKLNEEQLECVRKSLVLKDLLLLWGPPGTGKTTVIAEITSQYCRLGHRVLISSQANLAVDQALDRLPKLPHIRPARVSTSKQKNKLGIDVRSGMLWWLGAVEKKAANNLKKDPDPLWRDMLKGWIKHLQRVAPNDLSEPCTRHYKAHANVIGATCNETGKPDFYNGKEFDAKFDLSIVDEVSKATPPELLLPALIGQRTLLVGDHRQLPPVFRESTFPEAIANGELSEEEFERFEGMVTASLFEQMFNQCDPSLCVGLRQQYRMHPQIMAAVNRFYADKPLSAGGGDESLAEAKTHSFSLVGSKGTPWLKPGHHLVWIDSTYDAEGRSVQDEKIGTSRLNDAEAKLGVELLRGLLAKTDSIGFISLYRAQIQNIERLLREENDPMLRQFLEKRGVNTVDQFQGSEREVIIVSLTRTDSSLTGEFIKDFRRINVAISRAKKLLIVIGKKETFDSGMVDVPAEDGSGKEARAAYMEIRELAKKTGLYLSLQAVMPANSVATGHQQPRARHQQHGARRMPESRSLNTPFEDLERRVSYPKNPKSR
jgi:hypothetical protein